MVFQLCIFLFCIVYDLLLLLQVMLQVWRINITFIIFSIILSQWIYLFFFFLIFPNFTHSSPFGIFGNHRGERSGPSGNWI